MPTDREKAAWMITNFRFAGADPGTPISFPTPTRRSGEAQWCDTNIPRSLRKHFPSLRWLDIDGLEFRSVKKVGDYFDLMHDHLLEVAEVVRLRPALEGIDSRGFLEERDEGTSADDRQIGDIDLVAGWDGASPVGAGE